MRLDQFIQGSSSLVLKISKDEDAYVWGVVVVVFLYVHTHRFTHICIRT